MALTRLVSRYPHTWTVAVWLLSRTSLTINQSLRFLAFLRFVRSEVAGPPLSGQR